MSRSDKGDRWSPLPKAVAVAPRSETIKPAIDNKPPEKSLG
jgi:hypothetical protein